MRRMVNRGWIENRLRKAAGSRHFLLACGLLALLGTISIAYLVTFVVMAAALLSPRKWRLIALSCSLGSAIGATVMLMVIHHWGWTWVYEHFHAFASDPSWQRLTAWVSEYGLPALFLIALSPLPQTPTLVFFGIVDPQPVAVFFTLLVAKAIKYGVIAWLVCHFPERLRGGFRGLVAAVNPRGRRR
jgi:membrane protein YqaA with SNARE-associated domain